MESQRVPWSQDRVQRALEASGLEKMLDLRELEASSQLWAIYKDETIWSPTTAGTERVDEAALVVTGLVRIESSLGKKRVYHRFCREGTLLGLSCLQGPNIPHSAEVRAGDEYVRVLFIQGAFLREMFAQSAAWRAFMLQQMRDLISRLTKEVATLHHPDYGVRITRLLLDACKQDTSGWQPLPLTLDNVAALVGMSGRQAVSRRMNSLRYIRQSSKPDEPCIEIHVEDAQAALEKRLLSKRKRRAKSRKRRVSKR